MANESAQKLRGGYYTPVDLASFIARWIAEISPKNILEPSCGDGAFFEALATVPEIKNANIVGLELDKFEARTAARKANSLGFENTTILSEDFLGWSLDRLEKNEVKFDAVVGNPPFIRYQYLPPLFQERAEEIFRKFDLKFTKHVNAWVPFILASLSLLRGGGRLAMVVPAEIIHVTHAQSLRTFLGNECSRLVIIDPEEIWFENTLQGAVIILAEKKIDIQQKSYGLGIYTVKGRDFLNKSPESIFKLPTAIHGEALASKWTRALLNEKARLLFDEISSIEDVHKFSDIAKVDVGIVTGANKFFLVPDETVRKYKLSKWAHAMFGRSEHCPGVIYDEIQHQRNISKGNPTNFILLQGAEDTFSETVRSYIRMGEAEDLHTRYKCRIRKPWYTVPSVYSTEVGMLKRAHDIPRLIFNQIGAYTTDTAYRITSPRYPAKTLVASFINSLTALSAELEGRHYGGGVLELIPSEIERRLIP